MKVIGLTGGTGSGKSVVSQCLREAGAAIIDADLIAHQIIKKGKPAYDELVAYFGEQILQEDGEIFRRKLGEIVFRDKEKLEFLNICTHKYIVQEIAEQIQETKEKNQSKLIIIDAPLLIEAGLNEICDAIWVVYAHEEVRARRVMQRDGITYETAKARIANQKSWEEYKSYAHEVIDNSDTLENVQKQVESLMKKYA
ncbi:dephospho-CoA kinase [Anaerotignum propionicum]|jgi:dephospho-CoA kinase|uniref:Dephospho-CoA kinase n=1 Tax=Anaerotignum propionicum DSM 1682 TaxID=991789 RepID=A0A0X8V9D1_ANAPI|nr:dephospho-CoA kinase [Anaerotignum propionicum]AMJ40492.1 dephospho-CoA kinase [Anaerotignum propionicum DSM 1682]SHE40606.1 dephospho-CoA kinase [[Clostridium] propionicum DSM 1682] [Anaerotignum propionicum DSM 1682]